MKYLQLVGTCKDHNYVAMSYDAVGNLIEFFPINRAELDKRVGKTARKLRIKTGCTWAIVSATGSLLPINKPKCVA